MLMNEDRPSILLIRFSSLGDLVLLSALVEGIALSFPGHALHLATKEQYRELYEGNPHIERIHVLPAGAGFRELLRIRQRLAAERFEIIIDAHNVIRSGFLYHSLPAARKARLGKEHVRKLSLIRAGKDLFGETVSMKERYLSLLASLGADIPDVSTRLYPTPAAESAAEAFFEENGLTGRTVVALAPGARWETKRWPVEGFSEIARAVSSPERGVLVIGGSEETGICRTVSSADGAVDACGRLSIMETAAALGKASVLVTNDSAPLHIAEAAGTPVIALFGPTVRQFGYYPLLERSITLDRDLACRPCSRNGSRTCRLESRDCLDAIAPAEVLSAIDRVIGSTGEER